MTATELGLLGGLVGATATTTDTESFLNLHIEQIEQNLQAISMAIQMAIQRNVEENVERHALTLNMLHPAQKTQYESFIATQAHVAIQALPFLFMTEERKKSVQDVLNIINNLNINLPPQIQSSIVQ